MKHYGIIVICAVFILLCVVFTAITWPLFADHNIPMLVVAAPWMGLMLVPAIFLEAAVYYYKLNLTYRYALNVSTAANLVSTMIAVPVCWLLLLVTEFTLLLAFNVTFGLTKIPGTGFTQDALFLLASTWPVLDEGNIWFVPLALLLLQIPFCLASIYTELLVVEAMRPILPFKEAVIWANIASYSMTAFFIATVFFA